MCVCSSTAIKLHFLIREEWNYRSNIDLLRILTKGVSCISQNDRAHIVVRLPKQILRRHLIKLNFPLEMELRRGVGDAFPGFEFLVYGS